MSMALRPVYYEFITPRFERDKSVWRFAGMLTGGNREGMAILPYRDDRNLARVPLPSGF
jgi:hypothetical protein